MNKAISSVGIAIVIPSLNPDEGLVAYCAELRKVTTAPICLVDDGSDQSRKGIFDKCAATVDGVEVLRHERNFGKGHALKTAFRHLLEISGDDFVGCVTADGDGQHAPEDVARCMETLAANPEALAIGCRDFSGRDVPLRSKFGNRSMLFWTFVFSGHVFKDTQTGLRGIPASFMRELLSVEGERYEFETLMLLSLGKRKYKEFIIQTIYEDDNSSSHFSPLRDSAIIFSVMAKFSLAKFAKFVAVSLLSWVVDIGVFSAMYYWVLGGESHGRLVASVVAARVISMAFNYVCNRNVVFRDQRGGGVVDCRSAVAYLVLAAFIMLASYAGTKAVAYLLPSVPVAVVKIAVDLVLFLLSFSVQRKFVFGRVCRDGD